jgi:hypothetical protein
MYWILDDETLLLTSGSNVILLEFKGIKYISFNSELHYFQGL